MLSAEQLLAIRTNKSNHKSLPLFPPKDFSPTHSLQEKHQIECMVREKLLYAKEERAEKKALLSTAEWVPDIGLAQVIYRIGSFWDSFGFVKNNQTFLYPEEALFLIEITKLELWFGGIPISIQQAYSLLIQEPHCSLDKYKVFAHFSRQGYRVKRHLIVESSEKSHLDAPLPKKLKLDCSSEPLYTSIACNQQSASIEYNAHHPIVDTADFNCIPDFSGRESLTLTFQDSALLPENCRNRFPSYRLKRDTFFLQSVKEESEQLNELVDEVFPKNVSSWTEVKDKQKLEPYLPTVNQDNPLFMGSVKPLMLDPNLKGDVYSRLRIFTQTVYNDDTDEDLEIVYDVYPPNIHFRKSNPGPPPYSVVISTWNVDVPSHFALLRLIRQCHDNTILLVAVTGQGSSVSFYELRDSIHCLSCS